MAATPAAAKLWCQLHAPFARCDLQLWCSVPLNKEHLLMQWSIEIRGMMLCPFPLLLLSHPL